MAYTVPPKQVFVYQGRTYGAGDIVPGYTPAEEKQEAPTKSKRYKKSTLVKEPVCDVEDMDNLLTGDSEDGSERI